MAKQDQNRCEEFFVITAFAATGLHCTLLHVASERGYADIVRILLRTKSIKINAREDNGATRLMCASVLSHQAAFELLMKEREIHVRNFT